MSVFSPLLKIKKISEFIGMNCKCVQIENRFGGWLMVFPDVWVVEPYYSLLDLPAESLRSG